MSHSDDECRCDERLEDNGSYFLAGVCADTDQGECMTLCACGLYRPLDKPHGWKKPS